MNESDRQVSAENYLLVLTGLENHKQFSTWIPEDIILPFSMCICLAFRICWKRPSVGITTYWGLVAVIVVAPYLWRFHPRKTYFAPYQKASKKTIKMNVTDRNSKETYWVIFGQPFFNSRTHHRGLLSRCKGKGGKPSRVNTCWWVSPARVSQWKSSRRRNSASFLLHQMLSIKWLERTEWFLSLVEPPGHIIASGFHQS